MKLKKTIIISLVILCLLMIGAVSAATDTNSTNMANANDVTDEITQSEDTSLDVEGTSIDTNVLSKGPTDTLNGLNEGDSKDIKASEVPVSSYADLITQVNKAKTASDEVTIVLSPGKYVATGTMSWGGSTNHKLTIDGNGAVLDGNQQYKFIDVTNGNYLTLKNIVIQNYKNSKSYDGGIIKCMNGQIIIDNVTFISNTAASGAGGVLTIQGTNNLRSVINNSIFSNNKILSGSGGAISINYAFVTIENTQFISNSGAGSSGYGGAIYNNLGRDTIITNCLFEGNSHTNNAGAICTENKMTLDNVTFIENTANNLGGAIYCGSGSLDIDNSEFINNSAKNGGALAGAKGTLNCANTEFIENDATANGGAIYVSDSAGTLNCMNSNFTENEATNEGGAIYSKGNTNVAESIFKNDEASTGDEISANKGVIVSNIIVNSETDDSVVGTVTQEDNIYLKNDDLLDVIIDLKNKIGDLNKKIEDQSNTIDALNTTLTETQEALQTATGNLDVLNATLVSTQEALQNATADLDVLNATLVSTQEALQNATGDLDVLNATLVSTQGALKNATDKIDVLNATLVSTQGALKDATDKIDALNATIQSQNGTINALNENITNLQGNLTQANNVVAAQNQTINNLQTVVNELQKNTATLQKQLSILQAKIAKQENKPVIVASNKIFKVKTKTKMYAVALRTAAGKVLKAKIILLKVNGKLYKVKTNNYGKAIVKINNLKKKGTYKAIIASCGIKKTVNIIVR